MANSELSFGGAIDCRYMTTMSQLDELVLHSRFPRDDENV